MAKSTLDEILSRLQTMQTELELEIDRLLQEKRRQFHYTLQQGKVRFEQGFKALQRQQRIGLWRYIREARLVHILSVPIIYSLIIPLVLLDLMITLYQHTCFRLYGIPLVVRAEYMRVDRLQLSYLNALEKLNCLYCSYGNGLVEYCREISARTEQYWCPIKHARRTPDPHQRMDHFVDFGDAEAYKKRLSELRKRWDEFKADGGV
ncbi:hypothetical protein [Sedimenticola selenatireducens]|uniref:Uncharacterized protein n=1 Tax=Sedimenticola selenatireducens TaxID=191960 RepID=A0A558DS14_9GAMM|nr:hypothetical protein [Sedimenticola selenatireducens]TVO75839.1 hypothetical protein FHP88_07520 [Sedimenticola selenatireducens]TVT63698.1 MAG: hypothetical protein FHK78_10220 [Sedimenticola selenatireducens]